MKEEIKMMASISAKSSLKWLIVMVGGNIFTLILFFIILFQNASFAGGGHGNAYAFIVGLLLNNICGFILFVGAPVFAFLYFVIANKVAIQQMIYLTWKNKKFSDYIDSKVVFLVDKITDSNRLVGTISNESMLRLKLLEANKNDKESSRIKKKIINYLFQKIKLDDIDFSREDLKLSQIVSVKLNQFISETVEPSLLFFWLLLLLQVVLFVIAQF
ncbi:hypothetical protein [Flavobacterium quisquiliarum]|uniref:Uncharacterized protein n=1 Tax=Flavobacterium quisquiliarum TaxID=1834436 RepID=A0ABV8W3E7_9FLAO|nr:hypothetical protein [Flavobacterium quisquiliarum]MBW1655064.1 hypothetical protein [Flavobacterium quisquiliarum]NWL02656.1 hypothetical protein [Flavobacterium collinsii]